jgi:hypothetical protein
VTASCVTQARDRHRTEERSEQSASFTPMRALDIVVAHHRTGCFAAAAQVKMILEEPP